MIKLMPGAGKMEDGGCVSASRMENVRWRMEYMGHLL